MGLINWHGVSSVEMLIFSLKSFLDKVFGDKLLEEARKLKEWEPKGKPGSFEYLRPTKLHKAARWYWLLRDLEKRGYSFDLRFSSDIEEFMNLLLFAYSFDGLIQRNILSLDSSEVRGALMDRQRFESLTYEVLIAANYASSGFKVKLPDLLKIGRTDVYAKRGNVVVYAECKKLRRNERYTEIAINVMRELHEQKLSIIIDVTLEKAPKSIEEVDRICEIIKRAASGNSYINTKNLRIRVEKLPELIENIYQISIPNPETIEYLVSSSYIEVFKGIFRVKEPKVLILRNPNKSVELKKQLLRELHRAHKQLISVETSNARRVIYVDISEVAGKPILQLPELIRISVGPEILGTYLEQVCREWLLQHPSVDAVVLTQPRLYLDEFGNPYILNVEKRIVTAYTVPGWSIEVAIIPIPRNAPSEVLVNLGVQASTRGNYRLAMLYYKRAIEMNPNLKEAYNNLGKLLTDIGRPDKALEYLDKALELDSNYVSALINKGIALAMLGKYEEALTALNRALTLRPNDVKAWYNKALIHYMLGQYSEACKCVCKALTINPSYTHAQKLKEELTRLGYICEDT